MNIEEVKTALLDGKKICSVEWDRGEYIEFSKERMYIIDEEECAFHIEELKEKEEYLEYSDMNGVHLGIFDINGKEVKWGNKVKFNGSEVGFIVYDYKTTSFLIKNQNGFSCFCYGMPFEIL